MKTLLHNPVTHLFLKELGEWTLDPDRALSFKDIYEAIDYQIAHHLTEAQVFMKLEKWEMKQPTVEGVYGEGI